MIYRPRVVFTHANQIVLQPQPQEKRSSSFALPRYPSGVAVFLLSLAFICAFYVFLLSSNRSILVSLVSLKGRRTYLSFRRHNATITNEPLATAFNVPQKIPQQQQQHHQELPNQLEQQQQQQQQQRQQEQEQEQEQGQQPQPRQQQQQQQQQHGQKKQQEQPQQQNQRWKPIVAPLVPLHLLQLDDANNSTIQADVASHPFTSPLLLTSYIRPSVNASAAYDLYLFTAALSRRNLTATHCIVDGALAAVVESHVDEVVYCQLRGAGSLPREGARLGVALRDDAMLRASLSGPVEIARGLSAALRDGDILRLGDEAGEAKATYALGSTVPFARARVDPVAPPRLLPPGAAAAVGPKAAAAGGGVAGGGGSGMKISSPPRYALCLATMTDPGAHMLPDWVDHHRRLGVDHVYVFDNGAHPPAHTLALGHGRRGSPGGDSGPYDGDDDVEVMAWPWAKSQVQAFSFALLATRARCEYLMLADVDEFVMVGLGQGGGNGVGSGFEGGRRPLHAVIAQAQAAGFRHLQLRNLFMVNSGHVRRPRGTAAHVAELYTHADARRGHTLGKSICATAAEDWRSGRVHPCGVTAPSLMWSPPRQAAPAAALEQARAASGAAVYWPRRRDQAAVLVHFSQRSWEEWVEKWDKGRISILTHAVADERRGRYRLDRPDADYVRVRGRKGVVQFTAFRDFWRAVRDVARARVREYCVVRVVDGRREVSVVRL